MGAEVSNLVAANWPTLTAFAALLIGVYWCVRFLAMTFDAFADALGPLGKYWRARRLISQTEADDMRRRLQYLAEQVRALRHRDECYFAYTLYEQEWHRTQELIAITNGWQLEPHIGFLEFSEKWMRDRNIDKELDLWM